MMWNTKVFIAILLGLAIGMTRIQVAIALLEDEVKLAKLTLSPVSEPVPALKYRLLPGILDQRKGNAALFYHMAATLYPTPEGIGPYGEDPLKEKIAQWLDLPVDQLPRDEVRKVLSSFAGTFHQIELGARCDHCDWELPMEEGFFDLQMPPLSTFRSIARAMALKVRLQIADGHFNEAMTTCQNAMAMARHLAKGPVLVQNLVSISVSAMMLHSMEAWIQAGDAPNLYWALTSLPTPLIDTQPSLDHEQDIVFLEFSPLRHLDRTIMTPGQAKELVSVILRRLHGMEEEDSPLGPLRQMLPMAWVMTHYSDAKRYCVEGGWSQERIETMPAAQLVLCYQIQEYLILRDNAYKWLSVPYPQAQPYLRQAEEALSREYNKGIKANLFTYFMPALYRVGFLQYRLERDIAMLRVVEALRLYAAGHAGRLPVSLSQVEAVPIPVDPITGRAFPYHRIHDQQARLEVPMIPEEHGPRPVYELRVRP